MRGAIRFMLAAFGLTAGLSGAIGLSLLAHASPTSDNPRVHVGEITTRLELDGPPLKGKYIARGQPFYLVAEPIYDLEAPRGSPCIRDRIWSFQWQMRRRPGGLWQDLPGGVLEPVDHRVYRSYVKVRFDEAGDYEFRLRFDDTPEPMTARRPRTSTGS